MQCGWLIGSLEAMLGVQDREESGKESRKQAGDREGRKKNQVLEMAQDFGDQEVTGALGGAISVEGWGKEPGGGEAQAKGYCVAVLRTETERGRQVLERQSFWFLEEQRKLNISGSQRRSDKEKRKKAGEDGLSPLGEREEGAFCSKRREGDRGCWVEESKSGSSCWKKYWDRGRTPDPRAHHGQPGVWRAAWQCPSWEWEEMANWV